MALTATEEALVRQLLDQQAAILSLAGNEATITSKLGATKVTLSDLISASAVADADLLLMRQGTNDKSVTPLLLRSYTQDGMATQKGVQAGDYNTSVAAGTADALTGDYTPDIAALEDGLTLFVRATAANATTTPTFSPDGLTAKTIVKGAGTALAAGDIAGAGHWLALVFNATLDKWVLLNPYSSTVFASAAENAAGTVENKAVDPLGIREAFNATGSAPVYACRAWANFNGTGTPSIRASGNVSSITDNGTGRHTINFTTPMPDASYATEVTFQPSTTGYGRSVTGNLDAAIAPTVNGVSVELCYQDDNNNGVYFVDSAYINVSIHR